MQTAVRLSVLPSVFFVTNLGIQGAFQENSMGTIMMSRLLLFHRHCPVRSQAAQRLNATRLLTWNSQSGLCRFALSHVIAFD